MNVMNNIEMLVAMTAPIAGANQINLSGGVAPENPSPPPPPIIVVNPAPPPPAVNVQNIIPYVPPDDEIQIGIQPEVSPIAVSINEVFLTCIRMIIDSNEQPIGWMKRL
jgi:hypothetical protein